MRPEVTQTTAASASAVDALPSVTPGTEADPIKANAQLAKKLASSLRLLASLRGADTEDTLKLVSKEILAEVTVEMFGLAFVWSELTIERGVIVLNDVLLRISASNEKWF